MIGIEPTVAAFGCDSVGRPRAGGAFDVFCTSQEVVGSVYEYDRGSSELVAVKEMVELIGIEPTVAAFGCDGVGRSQAGGPSPPPWTPQEVVGSVREYDRGSSELVWQ